MASRIPRIPRLTLFSGPNCSLCDTAKSELAKVRQTRPFQLNTINIQDPGQDKWKKKYIYWIPALHLEGEEVAKGIWDARVVNQAIDRWELLQEKTWESEGIYIRGSESILGEDSDSFLPDLGKSRCFNCGSPDHVVSTCPLPPDHKLITLSRQLYYFIQASRGDVEPKRIHVVEEWKRQRLQWLEIFKPGEIRNPMLQDALEGKEGDWLKNIAIWGYPKGWVSICDPREHVRQLIWNENSDGTGENEWKDMEPFLIFGEDDNVEVVCYDDAHSRKQNSVSSTRDSSLDTNISPARWAQYPNSHFASHLLPTYNGHPLPSISHRGSSTYDTSRHELWQRILSGDNATEPSAETPPWRLPGAFSIGHTYAPPPPPMEPPPLPPSPPAETPPPLSRHSTEPPLSLSYSHQSLRTKTFEVSPSDEEDMDMSDSD